jgi:two-component sensor histidine kinase
LQLQSFHLEDKSPAGVLEDLESRIRAIAAVHEKLYQSESLMKIDVNEYVQDLVEHLFYSYGPSTGGIGLVIDIEDISCGIDTAVPLGLIVSELVSNSLKHAFPDGRRGSITISLNLVPEDELELTVSDNGVGMARGVDEAGSETLGLSLVKSLADQLHADIQLDRTLGTSYRFRFREVEKQRR